MAQINFARREIICKLVYYGPGLSGKTTNLEVIHRRAPKDKTSELTSIATEGDRTLFFDYMPLDVGDVAGMRVKLQLYTVPGQRYYGATRGLVLRGADGVVFVADSRADALEDNLHILAEMERSLREQGMSPEDVPLVLQWNKRDMDEAMPVELLEKALNPRGCPSFEAVAVAGEGVFPTLRKLAQLVLEKLNRDFVSDGAPPPPPRRQPARRSSTPAPEPERVPPARPARRTTPAPRPAPAPEPRPAAITDLPPSLRPAPVAAPAPRPRRWRLALLVTVLVAALAACAIERGVLELIR